jgi:ABC-type multidrug transport system permease subunit
MNDEAKPTESKTTKVSRQHTDDGAGKVTAMSAAQNTENFIETYHAISEWIRFADAKAAVILTVGGALAGFLIPTVHSVIGDLEPGAHLFPFWKETSIALFALYVLFFILSGFWAFLCINPLTRRGRHPSLGYCEHFHPAAIANKYSIDDVSEFVEDCEKVGAASLKREVQAAILLDSHISSAKYLRVRRSIVFFTISAIFGFAYFLIAQL